MIIKRRVVFSLFVGFVALVATGYVSNIIECHKLDKLIRKEIENDYARFRKYQLTEISSGKERDIRCPDRLPEKLTWIDESKLEILYLSPEEYEIPYNNEKGYIGIPNIIRFLGPKWWVFGKYGEIPCAFTVKRQWKCPFRVQVDFDSQIGPLDGFGGAKAYWSFFGIRGEEELIFHRVS